MSKKETLTETGTLCWRRRELSMAATGSARLTSRPWWATGESSVKEGPRRYTDVQPHSGAVTFQLDS